MAAGDDFSDCHSHSDSSDWSGSEEESEEEEQFEPVPERPVLQPIPPVQFEAEPKAGRPARINPLLPFPWQTGWPTTLRQFLHELIATGAQYNLSESAQTAIFRVLRRNLPQLGDLPFPSYAHSVSMLRATLQDSTNFPACLNDCYVHTVHIGGITPDELKALRCPVCNERMADDKSRALKVRSS